MKKERKAEEDINSMLAIGDIGFLNLVDFETSDSLTSLAFEKIILELKAKNEPIDSMFVTNVQYDSTANTLMFEIKHFNSFALEKELKSRETNLSIPPTGNMSGHDRTMIYFITKDTLNDLLNQ